MDDGDGPDPLDALGRELRTRLGPELRAEAEEAERLALQAARRRRTLADVARELAARGHEVLVTVGDRRFVGVLVHAAGDLAVVRTAAGDVDVNLAAPAALRELGRASRAGARADGPRAARPHAGGVGAGGTTTAGSFRARLFEIELAAAPVTLGCTTGGEELHGRITAVAVDHLVWQDLDRTVSYLPVAAVSHVRGRR